MLSGQGCPDTTFFCTSDMISIVIDFYQYQMATAPKKHAKRISSLPLYEIKKGKTVDVFSTRALTSGA